MIKQILRELTPAITEVLPLGAINQLARKHEYARQSISYMLRGQHGDEDKIREILASASEELRESSKQQTELADKIDEILNRTPVTVEE